jgi:hypothetical protein
VCCGFPIYIAARTQCERAELRNPHSSLRSLTGRQALAAHAHPMAVFECASNKIKSAAPPFKWPSIFSFMRGNWLERDEKHEEKRKGNK